MITTCIDIAVLNNNCFLQTIGRESTGSTYFFTAEVITIEDSSPIHSPSSTTPQPPLICGNSENENSTNSLQFCREQVSSTSGFPCRRCHGVFYCSIAHRDMQAENHRAFCKTQSCLEGKLRFIIIFAVVDRSIIKACTYIFSNERGPSVHNVA